MKRFTNALLVLLACALVSVLGLWIGKKSEVYVYAQGIQVNPYTLEADEFSNDGQEHVLGHKTEARRSDGSIAASGTRFARGSSPEVTFRSIHLADGSFAMVADQVAAKSSGKLSATELAQRNTDLVNFPSGCVGLREIMDAHETLLGQNAVRVILQSGKDTLVRRIVWRLLDFQCATVTSEMQSRSAPNQPWKTTLGTRLTKFSAGEPDSTPFANWLGYEEMKPSDIRRKLYRQRGVTAKECPQCFADDITDSKYEQLKSGEQK